GHELAAAADGGVHLSIDVRVVHADDGEADARHGRPFARGVKGGGKRIRDHGRCGQCLQEVSASHSGHAVTWRMAEEILSSVRCRRTPPPKLRPLSTPCWATPTPYRPDESPPPDPPDNSRTV